MSHLTDEQIDQIARAGSAGFEHLDTCAHCRARVAERRAIAERLRDAFTSIVPPADLAEEIATALDDEVVGPPTGRGRIVQLRRWLLPAAAAAAVLLAAAPLAVYLLAPREAAADEALAEIHRRNLSADAGDFHVEADPAKLADYLRDRLGFSPAVPQLGQGMSMRGCCTAYFRGKAVGSYVVQTPRGPVSIIVIGEAPKSLGEGEPMNYAGRTLWTSSVGSNNLVAMSLCEYAYCAVGEAPKATLAELLTRLAPADGCRCRECVPGSCPAHLKTPTKEK